MVRVVPYYAIAPGTPSGHFDFRKWVEEGVCGHHLRYSVPISSTLSLVVVFLVLLSFPSLIISVSKGKQHEDIR